MPTLTRLSCIILLAHMAGILVASEPSVGSNDWTNIPGVVEGTMVACPIDTTIPTPPMGYVEYLPLGYNPADTTTTWPLIIFLCGLGEAGDGTNNAANGFQLYNHIVNAHGPLKQVATQNWDFPCIILGPQDAVNWNSTNLIHSFVQYAKQNLRVDPNRIGITGLCDGSSGALRYAATYPSDIAALFPTETGNLPLSGQASAIANIPMWIQHDFADQESTCRYNSIAWMDQSVQANVGTSNIMGTYPAYGANINHYAVDADPVTGMPLDIVDGPTTTFYAATLTNGSKMINLNSTQGSVTYSQWSGSDAQPFAQLTIGNPQALLSNPTAQIGNAQPQPHGDVQGVAWLSYPASIFLTHPYSGVSSTQIVTVQMPVGYNNSAYFDPGSNSWNWVRTTAWDSSKPSRHMFTMNWYQDHTQGSDEFFAAPDCYNWALTQSKLVTTLPQIMGQPIGVTAATTTPATFGITATSPVPLYYQWLRNGVAIAGANSAIYTVPSCQVSDNGADFSVLVTNNLGSVQSTGARLAVYVIPPVIMSSPQNTTVAFGQTAVFNAVVTAGGTVTYQWYLNGIPIPGANGSTYMTPPAAFTDSGSQFSVVVQNEAGGVTSTSGILSVTSVPAILTQPQALEVLDGQQAVFSVIAAGSPPLSYQWYEGSAPIVNGNSATLSIPANYAMTGTAFTVVVSNGAGSATSSGVLLTVAPLPPAITTQPLNANVMAGQPATFSVTATGTAPLSYQWQLDGCTGFLDQDIGEVSTAGSFDFSQGVATLTASGGDIWDDADAFHYAYQPLNGDGCITAEVTTLTVVNWWSKAGVMIRDTTDPGSDNVMMCFVAGGAVSFQWRQFSENASNYTEQANVGAPVWVRLVRAGNIFTGYYSTDGGLWQEVGSINVNMGTSVMIGLATTAHDNTQVTAAAFANVAIAIPGASSSSLTFPATALSQNGESFSVVVSSPVTSVTSVVASLTVTPPPPVITSQPLDLTVVDGQMATFAVVATSSTPFSYQWYVGATPVSGATASSFSFTAAYALTGTPISVVVANASGSMTSNSVVLTVAAIAPGIVIAPQAVTVVDGQTATFSVQASGTAPLLYQWYQGTTPIPNAMASNYSLVAPYALNGTTISVQVSNGGGTIQTAGVLLTVTPVAPSIIIQPVNQNVVTGQSATFSITANGTLPLSYQWNLNGTPISGAVTGMLSVSSALATNGAQYICTVTNPRGQVSSNIAVLTIVEAEPNIGINGWTNIPGVVEGVINVHPVNATTPTPPLGYVEYLPVGYNPLNAAVKWPLVIYLHNTNESGNGTNTAANGYQLSANMLQDGPLYQVNTCHWDFPAIIIAPQESATWASNTTALKNMLTYVEKNYQVDTTRIFMTGMVDGAGGVVRYAALYPSDLAGILPIEVNTNPTSAQASAVAPIPMWAVHCFSDSGISSRMCSINWIDTVTVADLGGTSNCMATYPGYGGNANHYACDVGINGKPLNANGPTIPLGASTLTSGSKLINFPNTLGSSIYLMLTCTDALPFSVVQVAGETPSYTSQITYTNSGYLNDPYLGTSGIKNLTVQLPVGYNLTATRTSTGAWSWQRDQIWTTTLPSKRLFTLFYYQAQITGWQQTWNNAACWNWLFSQVK